MCGQATRRRFRAWLVAVEYTGASLSSVSWSLPHVLLSLRLPCWNHLCAEPRAVFSHSTELLVHRFACCLISQMWGWQPDSRPHLGSLQAAWPWPYCDPGTRGPSASGHACSGRGWWCPPMGVASGVTMLLQRTGLRRTGWRLCCRTRPSPPGPGQGHRSQVSEEVLSCQLKMRIGVFPGRALHLAGTRAPAVCHAAVAGSRLGGGRA